jgi:hypothetical protein
MPAACVAIAAQIEVKTHVPVPEVTALCEAFAHLCSSNRHRSMEVASHDLTLDRSHARPNIATPRRGLRFGRVGSGTMRPAVRPHQKTDRRS